MARRPVLEIDGVVYKNVYSVTYHLYTAKDETGRPSDRAHAGIITVVRESDETSDIARWAMDSSQSSWKPGKVIIKNPNDATMKELTWEEGFITDFKEVVPHIKDSPDDQVYEVFEISCHSLTIGDAIIDNRWEE